MILYFVLYKEQIQFITIVNYYQVYSQDGLAQNIFIVHTPTLLTQIPVILLGILDLSATTSTVCTQDSIIYGVKFLQINNYYMKTHFRSYNSKSS